MGKCADCKKMEKLTGYLCRDCRDNRNRRHMYRTNAVYREKQLANGRKTREKKLHVVNVVIMVLVLGCLKECTMSFFNV